MLNTYYILHELIRKEFALVYVAVSDLYGEMPIDATAT